MASSKWRNACIASARAKRGEPFESAGAERRAKAKILHKKRADEKSKWQNGNPRELGSTRTPDLDNREAKQDESKNILDGFTDP